MVATTEAETLTLSRTELFVTIFITGAAALTEEILGTRFLGPVFGVSLFVWSALLAVTLASLALGYHLGGALVDRLPSARLLGIVIAAAGVLLGLVPAYGHLALRFASELGPRAGALTSATLLFGPPLVALGMVVPISVRLATVSVRAAGRTSGTTFAVSTLGSLVGTIAMGFLIIPRFETDQILIGTAVVLIVVGSAILARHGRRGAIALALVPALATLAPKPALPTGMAVLDRAQSLYGLVEVIDDANRDLRFLRADHSIVGAQYRHDRSPAFTFIHVLEAARFLRPNMTNMLGVGLGAGSLPSALERYGVRADVVEIDPAVVRFAQQYFGFMTRGEIHVEDARTFLSRTEHRYDLVVHDTFTGGTTPEHLLSLEILQSIHALLRPGGVLVLNFAGYADGPSSEASRMVARTIQAVFPNVRVFRDSPPTKEQGEAGNLVFFASDGPLDFTIPTTAQFENEGCERIQRSFERWEVFKDIGQGPVITDGRNPLGRLQLPVAEAHFEAMNRLLPIAVWLN